MFDRICLMLGAKKCPVTMKDNPRIFDVKFRRPEKHFEKGEFYVQYSRNGNNVAWSTDLDCEHFFRETKTTKQPSMSMLIDNGTELIDVYRAKSNPFGCLAKYAMDESVHKEVFLWMFEMCKSEREIFDQFIQFYLNDTHDEFGGLTGSKAFYVMQLDKLRDVLNGDEKLVAQVEDHAGVNNCVAAARYAKKLSDKKRELVLSKMLARDEIPALTLSLTDRELSGFMKAVRLVLKSQS